MKQLILLTAVFFGGFTISYALPAGMAPSPGKQGLFRTPVDSPFQNSKGRQILINPDKSYYLLLNGFIQGEYGGNVGATVISKRQANGALDISYGLQGYSNPIPVNDPHAALQADGKIVITGPSLNNSMPGIYGGIVRLQTSGDVDSSFGINGLKAIGIEPTCIAIQNDGKIVVAGGDYYKGFRLARYTTVGNLDKTFNGSGKVLIPFDYPSGSGNPPVSHSGFVESIAIQPDGKIIAGGFAVKKLNPQGVRVFAIARCNSNGTLDSTFDGDGKEMTKISSGDTTDLGMIVGIQKDGKILLAGYGSNNRSELVRYNSNGSPDTVFNNRAKQNVITDGQIKGMGIQSDGKIVVTGYGFTIGRLGINGLPDSTFGNNGVVHTNFDTSSTVAASLIVQSDDKIVVTGTSYPEQGGSHFSVARYNINGSLDNTFDHDGKLVGDNNDIQAPPTVSITTPARDTNFVVGEAFRLSAVATDTDGTIQSVDFYDNDTTLLFTDITAPYSVLWEHAPTGSYHITAVATDNNGLKDTSALVHITVIHNRLPYVGITSPANGATYFGTPATIAISAAAVAYGGKIKTVKFYNGTKLIHTEENPPYLWTWKNVQEGIYKIMAKTMDTYGRENVSPTITITVSAAKCDSASKPTFSYSFNGTAVANINNGVRDPGEFASVTLCNGGQYTQSGFVSSDPANLYQLIYGSGGNNTLLFNGAVRKSRVLTTAQFAGLQHTWTVSLLNPDMPGFGQQTITPFKDLNHNGRLDAGDCAGDPIVESYGLGTCTTSGNLLSTVPADKKPGIYGVTTLQLLPNPARSVLNISITGVQQNKPTTISVISASGVIIKTLQAKSSAQTIPLNVSSLKSGMYVIKIISEGKVIYKPFVKM